ncbi:hypothetical protein ACLKA6_010883 [Drosophila palustris]
MPSMNIDYHSENGLRIRLGTAWEGLPYCGSRHDMHAGWSPQWAAPTLTRTPLAMSSDSVADSVGWLTGRNVIITPKRT